jgi:hypothetical protein
MEAVDLEKTRFGTWAERVKTELGVDIYTGDGTYDLETATALNRVWDAVTQELGLPARVPVTGE